MRPAESHTFQYTIALPQRKSKKRKAKPKATKQPKPKREPKRTTKTQRTPLSPEELIRRRQTYDTSRNKTPERQEYARLYAQEHRRKAKETGLCRSCANPAIPDQTRCESCAEKHRAGRRNSRAREQAGQESTATTVALPLDPRLLDDPIGEDRLF